MQTKALLLLVLSCFAAPDALVIGARPAVKRRAKALRAPPREIARRLRRESNAFGIV